MRRSLIPDIVTLHAFECAARHGNFSRAAEELNLTPSAVSRQIADLEKQTGLKLFERVRQRVILSESGQRILPEARRLIESSERFMIDTMSAGKKETSLRIATLPTFGAKWLVPRIGRFLLRHPNVALTIESRSSPFSFAEDNFDVAIHFGQPIWAGGLPIFLGHEQVLPVTSNGLALQTGCLSPADISKLELLHLTTRPKLWSDWFQLQGVSIENTFIGPRFDQFSMIVAAAIAGYGVALLPTYLIEEEIRSGALVVLAPLPMQTENAYYIVRPEVQSHPIANAFQDWLLNEPVSGRGL